MIRISILLFFNMHLLSLHVMRYRHCFVQMLTLVAVNRRGQEICHNTQPANQASGLSSAWEGQRLLSNKVKFFLINAATITDLQKCTLEKKKKRVDARIERVILPWWNCIQSDNLPEIHIPFSALQQPGKGVCFSGCEFIKLYFRNVKMVDFGD